MSWGSVPEVEAISAHPRSIFRDRESPPSRSGRALTLVSGSDSKPPRGSEPHPLRLLARQTGCMTTWRLAHRPDDDVTHVTVVEQDASTSGDAVEAVKQGLPSGVKLLWIKAGEWS
jgi:hypothetical protein